MLKLNGLKKQLTSLERVYKLAILGGIGLLVGTLLPWVTFDAGSFGTSSTLGYQVDGIFSGIIGLLAIIFTLRRNGVKRKYFSTMLVVLAVFSMLVVFPKFGPLNASLERLEDTIRGDSDAYVNIFIGPGLYISAAGAIILLVGGFSKVPVGPVENS